MAASSDPHELVSWVNQIASYPAHTTPQTPPSLSPMAAPSDPHELASWVKQIASYAAHTAPQTPTSLSRG